MIMKSIFKASHLAALVIACVFLTASAQAQSWLTNGLVAYYPFNGNANDATGNGNDALPHSVALAPDRFGISNAAYSFSNLDNYIKTPVVTPTNTYSICVWAYCINGSGTRGLLGNDDENCSGKAFWLINQQTSIYNVHPIDCFGTPITDNKLISLNTWNQLICSVNAGTVTFYLNGQQGETHSGVESFGTNWFIGGKGINTTQTPFSGFLDDVRIYNRALSSNEVAQLYAIESKPPAGFETNGLVAYYPFNGNANDYSGNGNNGTVNGAVLATDRFGTVSSCYSFIGNNNGSNNSYISVPSSSALQLTTNLTLSVWIKKTTNLIYGVVLCKGDNTENSYSLSYDTRGVGGIDFNKQGTYNMVSSYQALPNEWVQVVCTLFGANASVYYNGLFLTNGIGVTLGKGNKTLTFGTILSESISFFGLLDDIRIYNRALSSNEVAQLYAIESTPPLVGMALIPAGAFTMGDTLDGEGDALPVNNVYISAFYMDTNVVSYSQWTNVYSWATNHGYSFDNAGSGKATNHPVQTVNWYDSVKWCNARSEMESRTPAYYTDAGLTTVYRTGQLSPSVNWTNGYRLPTEAEWEKAARGGLNQNRFPWGNSISQSLANFCNIGGESYQTGPTGFNATYATSSEPYTSPVGSFAPNGYGLFDMAGNVWQWCWDWYGSPFAGGSDPRGASSGSARVHRGGGWGTGAEGCRSAYRFYYNPTLSNYSFGFRSVSPLHQSSTPPPPPPPPPVPASITNQPQDVYAVGLSSSYFSVGAAGTAPLAYQWRFNGTNIAGATNSSLTIGVTVSANIGSYTVVVTNGSGSVTSSVAKLYMYPYIYSDPSSLTVSGMGSATFSVGAIGSAPLRYQWKYYGANIPGATNASYTINNVTPSQLGNYYATVSNALGVATSATATLTMPPYLAVPFSGASTNYGDSTTLGVTAWGTGPLTFQWYQNGQPVAGATNQSLPLNNINFNNGGGYMVVVSSSYGSVTNPLQQVVVLPTQPYAPVTLSLTLLKQGSSTVSGGVSTTAAPTQIKLATKDVLAMLAMDEYLKGNWPSNSFPRTATLALVDDTFFVINGTNALLNVMDIMTLEYGDPQVTSGSRNVATGLASTTAGINRLANIVFNDTAINGGYKLHLYLYGVFSTAVTDTAPSGGVYTETLKVNTATLVGDGYSQNVPVTCTGTISATGKGTLKL